MSQLVQDGVLGIVTGILTTVILFLAKALWDAKLRPFLQELRYSGVKIDGKWSGRGQDEETGATTELLLFLTQSALELGGTFGLKHQSPQGAFDLQFNVSGRIWEGYVILNFAPMDRRVTSYATTMLKLTGGGLNLEGQIAYRDVVEDTVRVEPAFLGRE